MLKSQHGFRQVSTGRRRHNNSTSAVSKFREFCIGFKQDTRVYINCRVDGIFVETGYLDVWKGKQPSTPELIYLTPDRYSRTLFTAKKWTRFDVHWPGEIFYIARFKNGEKRGGTTSQILRR